MIPGTTNELILSFDTPGVYRGICSEFCGLQHAKMQLLLVVQPPEEFDRWLEEHSRSAEEPRTAAERRGREVFVDAPCAGCHTVRGVSEAGVLGPDLTHLASRMTLGAASVDLTHENLRVWVSDPDQVKPGTLMPPSDLSAEDLENLIAYLESLR